MVNDAFDPADYGINLNDPVRRAQLQGHLVLVDTAWNFLNSAVRDGNLIAVWNMVDEPFRRQLADQWVQDNLSAIRGHGYDESAVVDGLSETSPTHELWAHFERVHVRSFRALFPDPESWGIGANTRVVGPDLEALLVHDMEDLPDDQVTRPGGPPVLVVPMTFRRVGDQWLLAMIGNDEELIDDVGPVSTE